MKTRKQGRTLAAALVIGLCVAMFVSCVSGPGAHVWSIEGEVLAVDRENRLVILSVGRRDEVQKGYVFHIRKGNEAVGKVRVIKVYEDMSGCRILEDMPSTEVREGDEVSTRLFY